MKLTGASTFLLLLVASRIGEAKARADCQVTGCSGQLCAATDVSTTCEWLPEYQCYRDYGTCGNFGPKDSCAWDPTPDLRECLQPSLPKCQVTGCSSQLCADEEVITTCEWLPEYQCFRDYGTCGNLGPNGSCAWDPTPELNKCLYPFSGGDPHFKRFAHTKRSTFHGECDLVLLQSQSPKLAVHVRTTIAQEAYSFIEQIALAVGERNGFSVIEFNQLEVYLNGKRQTDKDFPIQLMDGTTVHKIPSDKKTRSFYHVDLPNGLGLIVKATKQFMSVSLAGDLASLEEDAVGMFGECGTGDLYGRDGRPIDNFEEHAFEWQVHPDEDGHLFRETRSPQWPQATCRMPSNERIARRALRARDKILYERATEACAQAQPQDVDLCVEVMLTGDIEILDSW